MSSRSLKNKLLTGLKVKKRSWMPKIKRRKAPASSTEQEETCQENQELYSINVPASITNLPTEIYLQLFNYLLFADLYTLSRVSKFFRELLWSKLEFTQSIWRNCRLLHYPNYPKLPPPNGMCEQQYIWITLAKKTCQFCNEVYDRTSFDKWVVKINCCNNCMGTDQYVFDENGFSKKRTIVIPQELRGCIPYTEYIGYLNDNGESRNHHKYYFFQDFDRIKNEYDSLADEEKQGWIENKRKELKDNLEKIKDYQAQDREFYWSQFIVPKKDDIADIIDDDDVVDEEEEEDDVDQDDQDNVNPIYDYATLLNQGYIQAYNPSINPGHNLNFSQVYNSSYSDYELDDNLEDYEEDDEFLL